MCLWREVRAVKDQMDPLRSLSRKCFREDFRGKSLCQGVRNKDSKVCRIYSHKLGPNFIFTNKEILAKIVLNFPGIFSTNQRAVRAMPRSKVNKNQE